MSSKPTVFILVNDPRILNAVNLSVQSLDLWCEHFESVEEFFWDFDDSRPGCLVTTDRMDGIETQQALQKMGAHLKVIVIMESNSVPKAVQAIKAGAITALGVPVRDDELCAAILKAVARDAKSRALALRPEENDDADQ